MHYKLCRPNHLAGERPTHGSIQLPPKVRGGQAQLGTFVSRWTCSAAFCPRLLFICRLCHDSVGYCTRSGLKATIKLRAHIQNTCLSIQIKLLVMLGPMGAVKTKQLWQISHETSLCTFHLCSRSLCLLSCSKGCVDYFCSGSG